LHLLKVVAELIDILGLRQMQQQQQVFFRRVLMHRLRKAHQLALCVNHQMACTSTLTVLRTALL
jgi:hypothetical protein